MHQHVVTAMQHRHLIGRTLTEGKYRPTVDCRRHRRINSSSVSRLWKWARMRNDYNSRTYIPIYYYAHAHILQLAFETRYTLHPACPS